MRLDQLILAAVVLATAGCSNIGEAVKVQRAADAPRAEPRPKDCPVEVLYDRPSRPYRALAELTSKVAPTPGAPLDVLRAPACELGADAVIVTRRFPANHFDQVLVSGTAIKYVEADANEPGGSEPDRAALPPGVDL